MADDPIIDIDPTLLRGRKIAETSRSYLDRNGKTPRGLSFYAIAPVWHPLATSANRDAINVKASVFGISNWCRCIAVLGIPK